MLVNPQSWRKLTGNGASIPPLFARRPIATSGLTIDRGAIANPHFTAQRLRQMYDQRRVTNSPAAVIPESNPQAVSAQADSGEVAAQPAQVFSKKHSNKRG